MTTVGGPQDGVDFQRQAPETSIVTRTTTCPLRSANEALADLRAGRCDGAAAADAAGRRRKASGRLVAGRRQAVRSIVAVARAHKEPRPPVCPPEPGAPDGGVDPWPTPPQAPVCPSAPTPNAAVGAAPALFCGG